MKRAFLIITIFLTIFKLHSQENRIEYNPEIDEIDNAVFMNIMGFDYHKFAAILGLTLSIIQVADNQLVALWR